MPNFFLNCLLPPEATVALDLVTTVLTRAGLQGDVQPRERMHVTLGFYDSDDPLALVQRLYQRLKQQPPLRFTLTTLGEFNNDKRVIWLRPAPAAAFAALHTLALTPESVNSYPHYQPHVTLLTTDDTLTPLPDLSLKAVPLRVDALTLTGDRDGHAYQAYGRIPLQGGH